MPHFVVSGLPRVIPQDERTAGWFAATRMLVAWRRARGQRVVEPDTISGEAQDHRGENALPWDRVSKFATSLGLSTVPAVGDRPTPALVEQWLRRYGPLLTDGVAVAANGMPACPGHVVVLGGVDPRPITSQIYVLDPWPEEVGAYGWRPFSQLTSIFGLRNDRRRQVSFLYYP